MCKITVVHSIPGRLRVRIHGLQNNQQLAYHLARTLERYPEIRDIKASTLTGKALIVFNGQWGHHQVIDSVNQVLQTIIKKVNSQPDTSKSLKPKRQGDIFEPEDLPIRTQVIQVVGSGLVLAFLLIKRLLWGKSFLTATSKVHTLAAGVTILTGYPVLRSGIEHLLVKKRLNNDFLISAATLVSLLLRESITGLVVIWLVNLSTLFQTLTLDKSQRAIRDMLQGEDLTAWLEVDGSLVSVPVESLEIGNIISCHIGEKIPVDGEVISGEAAVSQAIITGEAIPVAKQAGDKVFAGSIIQQGSIRVKAEKVGEETSVARIIQLVEQSSSVRAPIENLADRYSEKIVPLSFALSALVYLITGDFRRSMTMLIVACPCAAGLSTPTAISAAMGNAAQRGILIKGGSYLEKVGSTGVVLFDKTGTLTEGKPVVESVIVLNKHWKEADMIKYAAALEFHSNHPLAQAVVNCVDESSIADLEIQNKEVIVGHGVKGLINGKLYLIGSEQLMLQNKINTVRGRLKGYKLNLLGQTVLYLAENTSLIGILGISDRIRPNSKQAIRRLRQIGIEEIGLLTGDSSEIGHLVGQNLGLDRVWGQVLPEEKVQVVEEFQQQGLTVTMVGEGINDSPALARADIGIAMGTGGTDIAIESADIVLAGDNPIKVPELIELSSHTMEVVRQNFIFAVGINALGLMLGASSLISPLTAALLHNLSTFGVVVNSSRLLMYNNSKKEKGSSVQYGRTRRKNASGYELSERKYRTQSEA